MYLMEYTHTKVRMGRRLRLSKLRQWLRDPNRGARQYVGTSRVPLDK